MTIQSNDKALTENDINEVSNKIIKIVENKTGAKLDLMDNIENIRNFCNNRTHRSWQIHNCR